MSKAVVEQLKENLVPYLAGHGVNVAAEKFRCFSGKHVDTNPSCHVIPSSRGKGFWCFACLTGGDIFTAAHFLEHLPKEGPDFWKVTIPHLAQKLGVDYAPEQLSPEDKERYQLLAMHKDAAEIILSSLGREKSVVHKYLEDRKWTKETAQACGVGTVDSYAEYENTMLSLGWSPEALRRGNLTDPRIFSPTSLIFILKDTNGRPVGFAARNTNHGIDGAPKYVNSPESPIYNKSATLFMLDQCIDRDGALWIVEGYADAVSLWQAGYKKVCAIGGVYFTGPDEMHRGASHLETLIDNDMSNVVFCLDADDGGYRGTEKALDEHFPKAPGIMVRICALPHGLDPDDYINGDTSKNVPARGIESFLAIPLLSPFAWRLSRLDHTTNPRKVAEDMIPLILQETNSVVRWEMCRELSEKTGIPTSFLAEEISNRANVDQQESKRKLNSITKDLQRKLLNNPDPEQVIRIVSDAQVNILKIVDDGSKKTTEYSERVASVRNTLMDEKIQPRLSLGKYKQLFEALGGFPTDAQLMALTGLPNIGKTSLLRNLSWEMIRSNPDCFVVFMSIDDSFQKIIQGYVSLYTQIDQEEITNKVNLLANPAKREAVWAGFDHIQKLKDNIVVYDAVEGNTIMAIERHINSALHRHSGKKIVFILDNFHKLAEVSAGQDEPGTVAGACNKVKMLSTRYNIPILMNVELKKTEWRMRSSLRDMKGSMSIEYDCDLVMLLHQELHMDRESKMIWSPGPERRPMPINELEIAKNKVSGYKGSIYLKFMTSRSKMDEMAENAVLPILEAERKRVQERRKYDYDKRKTGWGDAAPAPREQAPAAEAPRN